MSLELPILFPGAPPGYWAAVRHPPAIVQGPNSTLYVNPDLLKGNESRDEVVDGIVKGEYHHWKHPDVKALDSAKNTLVITGALDDSRDLVALYAHEGDPDLPYSFRCDLFDLKYGAEVKNLDLYLLISWEGAGSGTTALPDGKTGSTSRPWRLAVKIDTVNEHAVLTPDGRALPGKLVAAGFHAGVDAVQFALSKEVLRNAGWKDGQPLTLQAFTTRDGDRQVVDFFRDPRGGANPTPGNLLPMAITTTDQVGRGRVAYAWHGNQELRTARELREMIRARDGTGFERLLESIERWRVPMELHLSGTLQAGMQWAAPAFLDRIRKLVDQGLVTIQGGTFDEQIMVYFPGEINRESLAIGTDWARDFGQRDLPVGWTPERIINGEVLEDFRRAGYRATIADYLDQWFPGQENDNRLHRMNDMNVFFLDHHFQQRLVEADDEGLDTGMRKTLLDDAIQNRTEVAHLGFNDWELVAGFPFLSPIPLPFVPGNFDNICRWIASHPWVEVTTPTKFLQSAPWVVNHGSGHTLPTQTYLGKEVPEQWYYGAPREESYYNYIPLDRGYDFGKEKDQIQSKKMMGDQKSPGTILHDTWKAIAGAPENGLKDLAKLAFFTHIYETAWHDRNPSPLYNRISGWERDLAAQVRQDTILAEGARWADRTRRGEEPVAVRVEARDLNQDGDQEVLVTTDRLFLVFTPVGGRLAFAACYDPERGPIPMVGNFLAMPTNEGEAEVNPESAKSEPERASKRLSGFRDAGYDDAIYSMTVEGDGSVTATSPDGKIRKRFVLHPETNELEVRYEAHPSLQEITVGIGLSPNLPDLLRHGQKHLAVTRVPAATRSSETITVRNTQGGTATLTLDGATLAASHRNFPQTHALYAVGRGAFTLRLGLEP